MQTDQCTTDPKDVRRRLMGATATSVTTGLSKMDSLLLGGDSEVLVDVAKVAKANYDEMEKIREEEKECRQKITNRKATKSVAGWLIMSLVTPIAQALDSFTAERFCPPGPMLTQNAPGLAEMMHSFTHGFPNKSISDGVGGLEQAKATPITPAYKQGTEAYAIEYNRVCTERHNKGMVGITTWEYEAILSQGLNPSEPGGLANVENSALCPSGGKGPGAASGGYNGTGACTGGSGESESASKNGGSGSSEMVGGTFCFKDDNGDFTRCYR